MPVDVEKRESHSIVPLTSAEEKDLERFESTIAANLAAFFRVAFSLVEIKEGKLYRGEFKTFEEYCRKRWDMNRAHAYRLICAAEVCRVLSPMGDIRLPENERQIRALTGLPPAVVSKAWRRAVAEVGPEGKITGAVVQKAVADVTRKPKGEEAKHFKLNWQIHVALLLEEAVRLTSKGDQEAVAEIVERVSLLLLVGRRPGHCDPAD